MSIRARKSTPGARDQTQHGTTEPAPLAADLRAGTQLAGYRIMELVGRGGMGVVYRAEHRHLQRAVALKLLSQELSEGGEFRERFIRESQLAASLQHPSIVTVYDAGEADGLLYIAMQFVDGTDLSALLRKGGALDADRALELLRQIADALDTAHQLGLVHRDVKPGNILIAGTRAYLTDFGLTRRTSSRTGLTSRGQFVGTIDYMAPEQIEGGEVDGRADVYALGCVLYHALTGAVPFEKDSDVSVIYAHLQEQPPSLLERGPGLPAALDSVIAKAMAKRREDRYGNCTSLIDAARAAIGQDSPPFSPPLQSSSRRRRKVLVAAPGTSIRAMASVALGSGGFELFQAADVASAVELARRESPELVLVDWALADACAALRAKPAGSGTKIVAMTSRADAVDRAAVRATGADEQLRKPFSSLQLLSVVAELLGPEVLAG